MQPPSFQQSVTTIQWSKWSHRRMTNSWWCKCYHDKINRKKSLTMMLKALQNCTVESQEGHFYPCQKIKRWMDGNRWMQWDALPWPLAFPDSWRWRCHRQGSDNKPRIDLKARRNFHSLLSQFLKQISTVWSFGKVRVHSLPLICSVWDSKVLGSD